MGFYARIVKQRPRSSVAEHQFCKLGVVGSNPTEGLLVARLKSERVINSLETRGFCM